MKNISAILTIILAGISFFSIGQNCNDYVLKFSNDKVVTQSKFRADPQSKSGLFKKGQKHTLNVVFTEGKEYIIKFYNSVPQNKVTYKMLVGAEAIFNYDNFTLQKQLKDKEEEVKQKQLIITNSDISYEEEKALKKERDSLVKEVGKLRNAVNKDKNTVPSPESIVVSGDPVNCVVEVELSDVEPNTPTSCIGVLILSKSSEGPGFQDDTFSKVQKEADAKKKAEDEAKANADAKAKADADAKADAEKKKKKKK